MEQQFYLDKVSLVGCGFQYFPRTCVGVPLEGCQISIENRD